MARAPTYYAFAYNTPATCETWYFKRVRSVGNSFIASTESPLAHALVAYPANSAVNAVIVTERFLTMCCTPAKAAFLPPWAKARFAKSWANGR